MRHDILKETIILTGCIGLVIALWALYQVIGEHIFTISFVAFTILLFITPKDKRPRFRK